MNEVKGFKYNDEVYQYNYEDLLNKPNTDKTLKTENAFADAKAAGSIVKVSSTQPTEASNKIWVEPEPTMSDVTVPTMEDMSPLEEAVDELKSDLSAVTNIIDNDHVDITDAGKNIVSGYIVNSNGSISSDNHYCVTQQFRALGNILVISVGSEYTVKKVAVYANSAVTVTYYNSNTVMIKSNPANLYRVQFGKVSGDVISDLDSVVFSLVAYGGINVFNIELETGKLSAGAYANSGFLTGKRSKYLVDLNGAEYLTIRNLNITYNTVVVYFYNSNKEYMSYAQYTPNTLYTVPVAENAKYIKIMVEADFDDLNTIDALNTVFWRGNGMPVNVANVQISSGAEKIVYDTVRSHTPTTLNVWGYKSGYIISSNGSIGTDPDIVYTRGFYYFTGNTSVTIHVKTGYKIKLVAYHQSNASFDRVVDTNITGDYMFTPIENDMYRVQVQAVDGSPVTTDTVEFDAVTVTYKIYDYTTSRLMLPSNYDPNGNPVPLILWMDGSGNFTTWNDNISGAKIPYLEYLNAEGFAVFSVFTWGFYYSEKYPSCGMAQGYPTKTHINSIKKGIEYICDRFNIDRDNIHVMSKSQGGQMAFYMSGDNFINAKSIGMFSPVLDYVSMPGESRYAMTRQALVEEIGLTGNIAYFGSDGYLTYSEDGKAFLNLNKIQIAGMNEAWKSLVGKILDQNMSTAISNMETFWTEEYWTTPNKTDIYTDTDMTKIGVVPVKIWGSKNDNNTPYLKMVEAVCQLQNSGCEAYMISANTGGHSGWDIDFTVESVTTVLGITLEDIPGGWIQNVEFIRQHMTL